MKTEVYSWRLAADLKSGLERDAQRRKMSLAGVLDLAARDWLSKGCAEGEEEEQLRLRKAASDCLGSIASGDARRSAKVRETVRKRLRRRRDDR